ncbi:MAG: alpha/beta hydrolase [Xanthomonadales bacterium]|nr:alpha/beta hydrolase [Xanthomonadales bacterium]
MKPKHFKPENLCIRRCAGLAAAAGLLFLAPLQAQQEIELETCELVVPGTPLSTVAQCGWLERAENPAEPAGRRIKIHVARVPARGRVTEPDPLVFFAGGPGQAASEAWPLLAAALSKVNESRDILLVDQRGTGKSNALRCPEMELEEILNMEWDRLDDSTRECLESLDADVRYYTTTIAMHDIDAAREALGYEQVNLFGGSYGTRAAQVYLRLFPDRVRTLVLDGVVPQTLALGTEHAEKLDQAIYRVLNGCEQDARCRQEFPDSAGQLDGLIRALDENPREVTVDHPTTGQPYTLTFNREVLASALRFLTYSSDSQAMLPLLIHEASSEQHFERLASQMMITATGLQQSISQGMELSVICSEDAPLFPDGSGTSDYLMGDIMLKATRIQCEVWPRGPVPEGFHEPVAADVPTLLLSGELDPVTPPEYAERVAAHFSDSTHLVAPGQGHIVTTRGCMGDLVSEFIVSGGRAKLDTECISRLEASPYFLSLTGPRP